jgi:RNA polymerase sigma-70 factor (ECF subfamily)
MANEEGSMSAYPLKEADPLQVNTESGESKPSDTVLVQATLSGNLEGFNRLVLIYQDLAFNVAYRILLDEDAAEDVTQNAFLSAYQHLNSMQGNSFRPWLMRILTNACIDELRRLKRRPQTALATHSETEIDLDTPEWMSDGTPSPEQLLEQVEMETALYQNLQKLSENYRVVLVLADIEGMEYKDIAIVLNKSIGTVKSRLARARARMRAMLNYQTLHLS